MKDVLINCGVTSEDISRSWSPDSWFPDFEFDEFSNRTSDGIPGYMYNVIQAVVQGPLGADRMDFILRDSYFTGTEHLGTISPQRIIDNALIYKGRLAYSTKVLSDVIQIMDSRMRMYEGVYHHKTVSASGRLIEKMLASACEPLHLIERTKDLKQFLTVCDSTIIGEIMMLPESEPAKKYCLRYYFRQLPKVTSDVRNVNQNKKEKHPDTINLNPDFTADFDKCDIQFVNTSSGESMCCAAVLEEFGHHLQQPFQLQRTFTEF